MCLLLDLLCLPSSINLQDKCIMDFLESSIIGAIKLHMRLEIFVKLDIGTQYEVCYFVHKKYL